MLYLKLVKHIACKIIAIVKNRKENILKGAGISMEDKISRAWDFFIDGNTKEARNIVELDFDIDSCHDFSLLNLMGYISLEEKHYNDAIKIFNKYISIANLKKDIDNEHIGLNQLAMVYRELGNYEKALELIVKEEEYINKYFPKDDLKKSVNNYEQGYLRFKLKNYDEAVKFMELSLKQSLETDDVVAKACANRGLGEIYAELNNSVLAKKYFYEAIALFESISDSIGIDEIKIILGKLK